MLAYVMKEMLKLKIVVREIVRVFKREPVKLTALGLLLGALVQAIIISAVVG